MKHLLLKSLYMIRSILGVFFSFREVAILAYHSVSNDLADTSVSPESFARQVARIQKEYVIVPLADVVAWHAGTGLIPKKAVALTFDDGYADFLTEVLPILEAANAPATLFVVGDRATYQKLLSSRMPMLDDAALTTLGAHPLITLGYHTKTHPDVRTLSGSALQEECVPQPNMRYFAYPGGNYSKEIVELLPQLGFQAAFSIKPELVRPGQDRFLLPRSVVTRGMRDSEVLQRISLAATWYRSLRRLLRYG